MRGFPLEITIAIIGELAPDKPSLASCSLASRHFTNACQSHLYSSVEISSTPSDKRRNDELHDILTHNAQLGGLISTLVLKVGKLPETEALASTLPMLYRVRHLRLVTGRTHPLRWVEMSDKLRAAFLSLFQPSLERVVIDAIYGFPVASTILASQVKHITCACLIGTDGGLDISDDLSRPPHTVTDGCLETLKILHYCSCNGPAALMNKFAPTIGDSRLRVFTGPIEQRGDTAAAQGILDNAAMCLEEVRINVYQGIPALLPCRVWV